MQPQTAVTYVPFPPAGTQVVVGAGVLTGVTVPCPDGIVPNDLEGGLGYSRLRNSYAIDAVVYDSSTAGLDLSTPILHVHDAKKAGSISVAFAKGLYIVQKSGSSLAVTWQ
jgi:hypothetical protein